METTIFYALLLFSSFALVCLYYLRNVTSRKSRIFLITLRAVLFVSLIIALTGPVLKFERFFQRKNVIPVFIDASESMRLFNPDSSVLPFLRSLKAMEKDNSSSGIKVAFYCFGDSLRPCASLEEIRFSDKQSLLPGSFPEKQARLTPLCLIVSDGHFSNASLPKGLFRDMSCLYCALPPASPRPFLSAELLSVNDHVELDSPSVASVRVYGYAATECDVQLICKEKTTVASRKSLHTRRRGIFSDTASLALPTSRLGRFLYSVTAVSVKDTLKRVLYFPQAVVSGRFSAKIISAAPSLDRRFLSLALQNDPQWNIASSTAKECDALFAIDSTGTMAYEMKSLARNGVAVFLGAASCERRTALSPVSFSVVSLQPGDSIFRQFIGMDLPPPSHLFRCSAPFLSRPRTLLGFLVPRVNDTIPFLSVGTYERRDAIAIAAQDLWHIDFWPLSVDGLRGAAPFLQCVVSFVKQRILRNSAGDFLVYPSASELHENDSLSFNVVLPSDLADIFREEHPALESRGLSVRFSVDSLTRTVYSTDSALIDIMEFQRGTVVLPPLHSGAYRYRCNLEYHGLKREFSDSLSIDRNQEELSVPGQNTVLLDQMGLPLKTNSPKSVLEAYAAASAVKRPTVVDSLELGKSWALLSIIFALLAFEWLFRRKQGLE
jgi:hypothetical protein